MKFILNGVFILNDCDLGGLGVKTRGFSPLRNWSTF